MEFRLIKLQWNEKDNEFKCNKKNIALNVNLLDILKKWEKILQGYSTYRTMLMLQPRSYNKIDYLRTWNLIRENQRVVDFVSCLNY